MSSDCNFQAFLAREPEDCSRLAVQQGLEPQRSNSNSSSGSNESSTTASSQTSLGSSRVTVADPRRVNTHRAEQMEENNCFGFDYAGSNLPYTFLDSGYMLESDPESRLMVSSPSIQALEDHKEPYSYNDTTTGRRYFCGSLNCTNRNAFTRLYDLQRHQRNHSSGQSKWHCGCCKKMDEKSVYVTNRRDRMVQHMRKKHSSTEFETCTSDPCDKDAELVFHSRLCLMLHKRDEHELTEDEQREAQRLLNADTPGLTHDCVRSSMSLLPPKRVKQTRDADAASSRCQSNDVEEADILWQPACNTEHPGNSSGIPPALVGIGYIFESHGMSPQTQPTLDLSQIPTLPVLAPNNAALYASFDDWVPVCQEVENVQPLDFLIGLEAFNMIESKLAERANPQHHAILRGDIYISYNFLKNKLKVQGPRDSIGWAVKEVEQRLLSNRSQGPANRHPIGRRLNGKVENALCPKQRQATTNRSGMPGNGMPGNDAHLFPLREKEDAKLISVWENCVLPCLSDILRPAIGDEYSACVVREGNTQNEARPCIQIESPELPDQANRKVVKRQIQDLIKEKLRAPLPEILRVYFYKGHMACLVNEDDDDDYDALHHEKRYWEKLGMSGSIGLMGSTSVSATSGGYILVDDKRYLLLANHFIWKSFTRMKKGQRTQSREEILLTSPSLADVEDYRVRLERSLSKHKDTTKAILNDGDISLQVIRDLAGRQEYPEDICELMSLWLLWLEVDRKKPDDHFQLGKIAYTCSPPGKLRFRPCVRPQPGENGNDSMRMDWALGEVTASERAGENTHRWCRSPNNPNELDYLSDKLGNPCEQTCPLRVQAKVHYVGRTSGLRRGVVSSTRMLVKKDGHESSEWFIIPGQGVNDEACAGDSGAWIITDSGNHLMAQLWGCADGKLLITPIEEVFKDIKEFTNAKTVRLPSSGKPAPSMATAVPCTEICEDKEDPGFQKKSKKIWGSSLPPLKLLLKDAGSPLHPLIIPTKNTIEESAATTQITPFDATLQLPPISSMPPSPVPSLISSTSSPGCRTPSPAPYYSHRSPTTPVQQDNHPLLPHSTTSGPIILEPDHVAFLSQEPEPLEEASALQDLQESAEYAAAEKRKKHSLPFILTSPLPTNQDFTHTFKNLTDKLIAMPRPTRPPRKTSTFPMFSVHGDVVVPPATTVAAN